MKQTNLGIARVSAQRKYQKVAAYRWQLQLQKETKFRYTSEIGLFRYAADNCVNHLVAVRSA